MKNHLVLTILISIIPLVLNFKQYILIKISRLNAYSSCLILANSLISCLFYLLQLGKDNNRSLSLWARFHRLLKRSKIIPLILRNFYVHSIPNTRSKMYVVSMFFINISACLIIDVSLTVPVSILENQVSFILWII